MNTGNDLVEVLDYFDIATYYRKLQHSLIKEYMKGNILEVGSGNGKLIEPFFNKNNKISLCEIDKKFFLNLKKKFYRKAKIYNCSIKNLKFRYDTILYGDVLEHIKQDKREILLALSKLKHNGRLIIIVPAFNFLYTEFDQFVGHYRRYNSNFFISFAKSNNLKIEKIRYFDFIGFNILLIKKIFSFLVNISSKKKLPLFVYIWDKLLFFSKFFDLFFNKIAGKSLLVIIKKNG